MPQLMPHLFTTETKNYRPLERRNDYPWEILRERLVRELGNDYATFLAEPVTRASEGFVDWYTEANEPAVPVADLAAEDREKLLDTLRDMRVRIYELADRIAAPGRRDGDKRFSDALRRVTVVPDDLRFVWSLGGKPVLVLWGMLHVEDKRSETEVLGEAVRYHRPAPALPEQPTAAPPPPVIEAPVVGRRRSFPFASLLWLLFAALVGVIYYLLFVKCDIAIGSHIRLLSKFGVNACSTSFASDAAARRRELEERIHNAELDIARMQGDCAQPQRSALTPPPPPPTPTPTPVHTPSPTPTPPTARDVCEALRARGAPCDPNAKLQISLGWHGLDDLDLHVGCPGGGELYYQNKNACAGSGYIDTNHDVNATPPAYNAVENAEWLHPPAGRYRVRINMFKFVDGAHNIPFTVVVKCGNEEPKTVQGHIDRESQTLEVADIDYPSCAITQR